VAAEVTGAGVAVGVAVAAGFDAIEAGAADAGIAEGGAAGLAVVVGAAGGAGVGNPTAMADTEALGGISVPTSRRPEPGGMVGEISGTAVSEEVSTGSVNGGCGRTSGVAEAAADRPRAMR
jgi:hypothetical protein